MASSFLPCLLAIVLFANSAFALTCYSCSSENSATCKYGFASFVQDTAVCASAGAFDSLIGPKCYKITGTIKGETFVAKGCQNPPAFGCSAIASSIGWLSKVSGENEIQDLNCITCDSDKCNSARRITGITFVGLLLATAVFFF